ncbi:hypothetical protein SELMODRAFT_82151 [Selaginella moellendorffii]|uniref:Peptidase M1 leukotriene A4 hydrolase/aminopeptidase C-terminal domain-containing protein n=1 Tax=Selaginella moellendorffii TaxID=88036 RepID=D8QYP4_SELML|nr:leukotriene A-4 hydrolase homolog [Selaginella moellendorffii]EFJ34650.1 hypothetical protein SELMODRAFT_82151 [Selaginella moellendorffii]|eukprot:XP_002964317.1 leukotriene A-4 hydrolase homolog [Selaginella moellendorffii]
MDPHSYADFSQLLTDSIALDLFLDFERRIIVGSADFTLRQAFSGDFVLDTRDLLVRGAFDSSSPAKKPLAFDISSERHPIKGQRLVLHLPSPTSRFLILFTTSPQASALQWLDPSQASSGKHPFVYTHCQALHARSIFPCQDTPSARFRFSARINIPQEMRAVMSAAHVERLEAIAPGRAVEVFKMEQPIPPYLFALAAGEIACEELGARSRVYGEPGMVKAAAREFAATEGMIEQAEALFGPYDWERFDMLVLPPSFPYGGMENPRMVFLTPTVIVGDRSGASVVAHELAHSWTGNLITNASANDFWLNEGFTTYAERRIVEVLDGKERVALHYGLGWNGWEEEIERFKDRPEFTKLKTNQENVDPDEVYSQVPYEKGCFFLKRLEDEVSRPAFDDFLERYIAKFRFTSIDTETFLVFLRDYFPGIDEKVNVDRWIYEPGMPPDAPKPKSGILERVLGMVAEFKSQSESYDEEAWKKYLESLKEEALGWQALEWQVYLESLPKKVASVMILRDLDSVFHLSRSPNWDLRVAFLVIAANSGFQACYNDIEQALMMVGRMRYLRPLYSGLLDSKDEAGMELAKKVFAKARPKYHPIARSVVEGLMKAKDRTSNDGKL